MTAREAAGGGPSRSLARARHLSRVGGQLGCQCQRTEAIRCLDIADEDLRVVELCLPADPAAVGAAADHCQWAAATMLKALHVAAVNPFRKAHDLEELAGRAAALWPALSPHVEAVATLSGRGFSWS